MTAPALFTPEDIEAELALTAGYDIDNSLDLARRRVIALRRKLDLPHIVDNESQEHVELEMNIIQNQLQQALAWIRANSPANPNNPDVVHADFSTFRGYRCS
jgi:hypothetical protein